jgi:hypothetical protein
MVKVRFLCKDTFSKAYMVSTATDCPWEWLGEDSGLMQTPYSPILNYLLRRTQNLNDLLVLDFGLTWAFNNGCNNDLNYIMLKNFFIIRN